jgi:hypothetical protein
MKQSTVLIVASLVSLLLFEIHVTDDMVRGMDHLGPVNVFGEIIAALWLYGALVLGQRLSGHIIMLLGAVLSAAVPILHLRGSHLDAMAASPGAFRFILTLFALGPLGVLCFVLAVQGMWRMRKAKPVEARAPGS